MVFCDIWFIKGFYPVLKRISMQPKKVLITGGLGFIGSHLAERCVAAGHDVTLLSRSDSKAGNISGIRKSVRLMVKDVKDMGKEVSGFDIIFHLAGSTDNYAIIEGEPYKDIEMNCTATISLLESIRKYNPRTRLVFASTFFVNGRPAKLPVTPDTPCEPLGLYGATRLAAEHFCRIYHNVFGLDVVIARFTNVFGDRELVSRKKAGFNYMIANALRTGEIPLYSNGDFVRDYIYVTDVADACLVLAEKGGTAKTYYVGRGERVKFRMLAEMAAKETGAAIKPVSPPDFHNRVGIRDFVCDNRPLLKLGWKPKVSLEEGIRMTAEYYRNAKGRASDGR
jgi:nucleoside-diphosphate-sugar epimerase